MYFITAIISQEHLNDKFPLHNKLKNHTFGYYPTFEEAHAAVTDNVGNMCECMYDYIVIENIPSGVHALSDGENWYQWSSNLNCWQSCVKPEEFRGIINFALG